MDVADILAWEAEHGTIPEGAVVIMYSGWGENYSKNPFRYFGATKDAIVEKSIDFTDVVHTPGFSGEAAQFLVKNRKGGASSLMSISGEN